MPKEAERNPANAAGDWYIDMKCIDCAAAREVAPGLIVRRGGKSVFGRQPATRKEEHMAWRAALLCPTASVGRVRGGKPPPDLFPQEIAPGVFRCGYNALSSFGAHSYFAVRKEGNILVDSPRYVNHLVEAFEKAGGIADVLLTHRDDIVDADRYAKHFGARVFIHEDDADAAPYATNVLKGTAPTKIDDRLSVVPVPGHTKGSVVYLLDQIYLFAGDTLAWDPERESLTAFRQACWYSWSELKRSLACLDVSFEWVLPGHGHSHHLSASDMREHLRALVGAM
jgi:glyoxylase-like metal-dependent hydrolase (beta-lactamase superfamily II)